MTWINGTPFHLALMLSSIALSEATSSPLSPVSDPIKISIGDNVKVEIDNLLKFDSDFTIHCKSGDDDLGTHVIKPHKQYGFGFKVNFIETTLFFCGVTWHGGHAEFDIYKAKRDSSRCPHLCSWQVTDDGLYGFSEKDRLIPDIAIPWTK